MGFLPDLDHSTIGDRINVVCELVLAGSDEKHLVRIMGTSTLVIFHGALSPGAFVWTFLDVMVCEGIHKLGLRSDSKTYCYGHSPMSIDSLTCAVELCAGAGFLSTGLQAAGFDVIAGVEQMGDSGCCTISKIWVNLSTVTLGKPGLYNRFWLWMVRIQWLLPVSHVSLTRGQGTVKVGKTQGPLHSQSHWKLLG